MKNKFLRLFLVGVLFCTSANIISQTKQYTLNDDKTEINLLVDKKKTKFTSVDIEGWKKGRPLPEAQLYVLDISSDTIGVWNSNKTNEKNWRVSINIPEAKAFFVSFDQFYLPQGSKLYAFNQNDPKSAVVFTYNDNLKGGAYSLEGLSGDNVTLEYVAPTEVKAFPKLHLRDVGYKYIDNQGNQLSGFDSDNNFCMINVNCPEGNLWEAQKKGVLQLRMRKSNGRTYLCSASIVNNTAEDKTPYVLTAEHCFEDMNKEQIEQTEFFFDYESPFCEETALPVYKYHKGSELLILNPVKGGSDGALLRLSEKIPEEWDVYFNGWDRENVGDNITNGATIHHPLGDVKKITFYDTPLASTSWNNTVRGTHWLVYNSLGATDGGSSGAPLFSQDGLIVGTLTGGDGNCQQPNYPDSYGKFWYHWDQHSDADKHMSKYLDPLGTNKVKISGLFNNEDAIKDIYLDKYSVTMSMKDTAVVKILGGNAGYSVSSKDESIASVELDKHNIFVTAHKLGSTDIIVSDGKGNTREVNISVHSPVDFLFIDIKDKILKVDVYKEGDNLKEIRLVDLDGDVFLHKKNLNQKSQILDLNILRRGVYVLQIKTHGGISKSEKIIW